MAANFVKPENALKRAEEYVNVGDKPTALQTLHAVLSSKRHHAKDKQGQKVLEKIMLKYLDLCIEMRRGKMAKDGLHQYKYVMKSSKVTPQAQHAPSLEVVIRHYLANAKQAAQDAQSRSDEIVGEIEDLDAAPSAESLLFAAAHGGDSRHRPDRQLVTPWLKFLWETYRTVLEILRNHAKLEHLYTYTAQEAFNFCETYNRKTEFKRLSEILRNHLQGLNKPNMNQQQGVTLSNPETVQILLEVRFAQLNVATKMELWQESFRSVEDIHNLMTQTKKTAAPEMLCIYYERLTQIFWQAKNYLFHSYSCLKYFNLLRKLKQDMSEAQTGALASQVLLAALSIPVLDEKDDILGFDFDVQKEKNYRLANLLGFSSPVPRGTLIKDLEAKNIMELAYPELRSLHTILEQKLSPLTFGKSIQKFLDFIQSRSELQVYAKSIAANAFRRLMQQVALLYQSIKLDKLFSLASFIDPKEGEKLIVQCIDASLFEARIDHRVGVVRFITSRLDASKSKCRLSSMSSRFEESIQKIDPNFHAHQLSQKKQVFARIMNGVEEEHASILIRKAFIEKRKEAEEERKRRKIKEQEEKDRLEQEAQQRVVEQEAEEQKKLQERIQEKLRQVKLDQLKQDIEKDDGEIQDHVRKKIQKLREEKEDMEKRLKRTAKVMDHMERARREEERPLLDEQFQKQSRDNLQYQQEAVQRAIEDARRRHEQRLSEKKRLSKVLPHRQMIEEKITTKRMKAFEQIHQAELARRREVQERVNAALARQEELMSKRDHIESQVRKVEDEIRKKREEEEKKRHEAVAEREKLERERREKLEKQAQLQREREKEIAEKQRAPVNRQPQPESAPKWGPAGGAASSSGTGKWEGGRSRRTEQPSTSAAGGGGSKWGGGRRWEGSEAPPSSEAPPPSSGGGSKWSSRGGGDSSEQPPPSSKWSSRGDQGSSSSGGGGRWGGDSAGSGSRRAGGGGWGGGSASGGGDRDRGDGKWGPSSRREGGGGDQGEPRRDQGRRDGKWGSSRRDEEGEWKTQGKPRGSGGGGGRW